MAWHAPRLGLRPRLAERVLGRVAIVAARPGLSKGHEGMNIWHGCYNGSHKSMVTRASFAHPAKMAVGLCRRIFEYGRERGYWQPGQLVLDPFAGIGTTLLIGAHLGYRVYGVELEPRFVAMAQANIERNRSLLEASGKPLPVILQGDSRQLRVILSNATGVVTSPPYADGCAHTGGDTPTSAKHMKGGPLHGVGITGVVSSPPYAESIDSSGNGIDWEKAKRPGGLTYRISENHHQAPGASVSGNYGGTAGQIGAMPVGAVTSPPYAESEQSRDGDFTLQSTSENPTPRKLGTRSYFPAEMSTPGQIGALSTDTYWGAVAAVYRELFEVLVPGGVAAIVVKDYVRDRQIVPLVQQAEQLLQALGFTHLETIYASLVKERSQDTLFGETVTRRTERKSFFRRLAEKNGSPRIDYECVIFAQAGRAA